MAELSTLARPYAKAAFEFALSSNALAAWEKQLATAAAVVSSAKVKALLASPALTGEQQAQRFIALFGDALGAKQQNFIKVLAAHKRLRLLPNIYQLFAELKALQEQTVDLEVSTAFALDDALQNKLAAAMKKQLQREVKVSTVVDSSLLGGVIIRSGDMVIDGSVRGRLAKLAEAMQVQY